MNVRERPRVRTLRRTCIAAPSQWEGLLEDGRSFYIRYRGGCLALRVSPDATADVTEAVRAPAVAEWQSDDPHDGYMDGSTMIAQVGTVLDFSEVASSAASGTRQAYLEALREVPDVPPQPGDELLDPQ